MQIKPLVYVTVAAVTIGLLVVSGGVLGHRAATRDATMTVPVTAPDIIESPTPTPPPLAAPVPDPDPDPDPEPAPDPDPDPIQEVGIQPSRILVGTGPYGSVTNTGTDTLALTFDDGPNPYWTPQVLDVLRQAGVKATFCLVGTEVAAHPDLVRAIVADGHTLCDHSWNHNLQLGAMTVDAIKADMQQTLDAIEAAVPGTPVSYFRAPGGNWTASIVAAASDLGMSALDWSVDPRDWEVPPVANIISTIEGSAQSGAIFLLHDGGGNRANSVEALRQMLPVLAANNAALIALPTGG